MRGWLIVSCQALALNTSITKSFVALQEGHVFLSLRGRPCEACIYNRYLFHHNWKCYPLYSCLSCHCWKFFCCFLIGTCSFTWQLKALETVVMFETTKPAISNSKMCHFCRIWQFWVKFFVYRLYFLFDCVKDYSRFFFCYFVYFYIVQFSFT